jgi:hypothetical protein
VKRQAATEKGAFTAEFSTYQWSAGEEKVTESGQVIGIDEVDAGVGEELPGRADVRRAPEPDFAALAVSAIEDEAELMAIGVGDRAEAAPLEVELPVIADQGDEMDRVREVEIGDAAVVCGETDGFVAEGLARAIAGENDSDGVGVGQLVFETGEDIRVIGEQIPQGLIGSGGIGFDVDQENELRGVEMDAASMRLGALTEGTEVKGLECSIGGGLVPIVGDEQLAIDQVNIGLDARESVIESVEERTRMFVIVMGMSLWQGHWFRGSGG